MSVRTGYSSSKQKLNQGVAVLTRNGLPVDSYLTIEGTRPLYKSNGLEIASYNEPVVQVPSSVDLEKIRLTSGKYTGKLVLVTKDGSLYFIDRQSMDNINKTFSIYNDIDFTESPSSIELGADFTIAEANLVNKLATTSAAHIDEVEFNGFDVSFNLDGSRDSVAIYDGNNRLTINPDGSINVVGDIEADVAIDAEQGDTIALARHPDPFERVSEFNLTAAQLDTETFTEVYSFTNSSLTGLRIKSVKADAATYGIFRVKVNGVTKDRYRTSPLDRNCKIVFDQEIDLPQGQDITLEFVPERIAIPNFDFFVRLEGFQIQ